MSYNSLTNKSDGVVAAAEDNKDAGVVATDADDAGYQQNIDPNSIKGSTPSPGQGNGVSVDAFTVGDPRFA